MSPAEVALVFVGIPLLAVTVIAGAVAGLSRSPQRSTFPVLGVPDGLDRQPDWSTRGRTQAAGDPPHPASAPPTLVAEQPGPTQAGQLNAASSVDVARAALSEPDQATDGSGTTPCPQRAGPSCP